MTRPRAKMWQRGDVLSHVPGGSGATVRLYNTSTLSVLIDVSQIFPPPKNILHRGQTIFSADAQPPSQRVSKGRFNGHGRLGSATCPRINASRRTRIGNSVSLPRASRTGDPFMPGSATKHGKNARSIPSRAGSQGTGRLFFLDRAPLDRSVLSRSIEQCFSRLLRLQPWPQRTRLREIR